MDLSSQTKKDDRKDEASHKATEAYERALASQNIADVDAAIPVLRHALDLGLDPKELRTTLDNLSWCLRHRYQTCGEPADLSSAIAYGREALSLTPAGHPDRHRSLMSLGASFEFRYQHTADSEDIVQALGCHLEALQICPEGNKVAERTDVLLHLGRVYSDLFKTSAESLHLDESIKYSTQALNSCPHGDAERPTILTILACAVHARFSHSQVPEDQDAAIDYFRQAWELTPRDNWLRSQRSANLAMVLNVRFDRTKDVADLDECIVLDQEAVNLSKPGEPRRSRRLDYLGRSLQSRLRYLHDNMDDITRQQTTDKIATLFSEASCSPSGRIIDRLEAAHSWRLFADEFKHSDRLNAYRTSLNILDAAATRSSSLEKQYSQLSTATLLRVSKDVTVDAAALAIDKGETELAVALLEQGRARLFSELGRYRTTLDDLEAISPLLAARFAALSNELDALVISGVSSSTASGNQFEDDMSRYQRIHAEWSRTLAEIRALDGVQDFLRPARFSELKQVAEHGPVIVINISRFRSDAIILPTAEPPVVVPLPDATPEGVQLLANRFGARPAVINDQDAVEILREIWRVIVRPVVTRLRSRTNPLPFGSRIWWCPTGAASRLPLHAAGPYMARQRDLPHIFTSSYTPTLGTLIRARKARRPSNYIRSLLVVAQPETPGEKPLPSVLKELEMVQMQVHGANALEGSAANRDPVLKGIADNAWIHLACHGHHNSTQPFLSHFSMHDGPISLLDIIHSELPMAEMAVLSACHSARVSEQMPDEVLHPAAGMMFAGFRSVVGTMWALEDSIGPHFTEVFYNEMTDVEGEFKSHTSAAFALRKAVTALGVRGTSLVERINLVHFGA